METPLDPSTQTPPAPPAPTPTPLSLFEKISERWHRASITKKVSIFLLVVAVFAGAWFFTRNGKFLPGTKTVNPAASTAPDPAPAAPAAAAPKVSAPPTSSIGGITVTNPVVPITINGDTVNGGIHVYVGSTYSSTGEKVTPGRPPEDTYVKIVPGATEMLINPGEIAYADFTYGMQGFRFTHDKSRTNDVRALYDGVPINEKHDLANTQRVTVQNTGKTPLKLEFSGW